LAKAGGCGGGAASGVAGLRDERGNRPCEQAALTLP
jgi:hypothetical protein